MLLIEKVINNNENWREFLESEPFCIKIKEKDNYFIFNYDQVKSDFSERIVRECRGIIFYKQQNGKFIPVCVPMFKFFNYGESNAANIDWESAKIQEKIDGSLIKLFYHNGWKWATNGTIDANDAVISGFDELKSFMDIIKLTDEYKRIMENIDKLEKENTYMFELVSPYNKVVVPYEKPKLYILCERNNKTFVEYFCPLLGISRPKQYDFEKDITKIVEMANNLPFNEEGYVVVDKYFNRIKVKSPAYVAASHLRNNGMITPKRVLDLIKTGEQAEFLTYYPEYAIMIKEVEEKVTQCQTEIDELISYLSSHKFEKRSELAEFLSPKKSYLRAAGFLYVDGKYEKDWFINQESIKILRCIGY